MDLHEFQKNAHRLVDWMSEYLRSVEQYSVKSQVQPGEILAQLPESPPLMGESFDLILKDVNDIIIPGVTHWQHPMFYAYFPANSSPPSILAEMITATLGLQCMLWDTSPAATELEQRVMEWLREMTGLPQGMKGVIQDTGSVSTLCALLTAREKASDFQTKATGILNAEKVSVYASIEAHSSIEKALSIAGIGSNNLRKIPVDQNLALKPELLEQAIISDIVKGRKPLAIVATLGTTGTASVDPLRKIGQIAERYNIWLHVDAAYAGSALILPEMRWMIDGIEYVDSLVMNPHKWLMVNFDCSALYVRDTAALQRTFEINPEYLKTAQGPKVNDYRNFGIQLGRRFRALKLWMVMRSYGVEGLQSILRNHIALAKEIYDRLQFEPDFEIMAPCNISLVCVRYHPLGIEDGETLNELNRQLLEKINASGIMYLTHTKVANKYSLRLAIGQTYTSREHVMKAYDTIVTTARNMKYKS